MSILAVIILTLLKGRHYLVKFFSQAVTDIAFKNTLENLGKAIWMTRENPLSAIWLMEKPEDFTVCVSCVVLVLALFPNLIN